MWHNTQRAGARTCLPCPSVAAAVVPCTALYRAAQSRQRGAGWLAVHCAHAPVVFVWRFGCVRLGQLNHR
jgi:hypothetical protein